MKIKEVADQLNLSPRAIRFYEEKGLISPEKEENRYRVFSDREVERLKIVTALREIGMPVEAVKKALVETEDGRQDELLAFLEKQRSQMTDQWVELRDMWKQPIK